MKQEVQEVQEVVNDRGTLDFKQLGENSSDLIIVLDSQFRYLYLNPPVERLVGKPRESLLGCTIWQAAPHTEGTVYAENYRRAMRDRIPIEFEAYYAPLDRWNYVRCVPEAGGGLIVFARDTTDEHKAEQARAEALQALRTSEVQARRAARVLDSASDAYITLDRDWRITYVNAEAARINQKPAEAFLGRLHWDEWPASIGTEFERQFRRAMEERVTVHFLERYHVPGEYDDWIDVTAYPADDEDGGGIHCLYRDVTERIQRERRERFLADLAERARTLTDPMKIIADAVGSLGEFLDLSRCTFADIDLAADTCTVAPDYRADETVPSLAGALPWSSLGTVVCDALEAGQAVVVNDVQADPTWVRDPFTAAHDGMGVRAHVSVPAVHSTRLVSVLCAQSVTARSWKPEEVELLQTVVDQTWLTVEVARQQRALQEEVAQRRDSEEYLRRLIESSPDCIKTMEMDGTIRSISEGGLHLLEIENADSVCGTNWETFFSDHRETLEGFITARDIAVSGGRGRFQGYCPTRTGKPRWWDVVIVPILGADGRPERLLSASRDVTEQRLAADRTRARAEREALVNKIGDGIRQSLPPEEIEKLAVFALGKALSADRCYLFTASAARDSVVIAQEWCAEGTTPVAGRYRLSDLGIDIEAVFGSGKTLVIPHLQASDGRLSDENAAANRRLEVSSLVNVPYYEGGQFVGALAVAMSTGARDWTPDEIALTELVAAQLRSTVEAARLQQREHNIATQLQDALQPPPPPQLPGMRLASFYRPALQEAGVGGDFFDVFDVQQGCTGLIVADLSGKGLSAASEVATVRNMARYALYTANSIAEAITGLNQVLVDHNLLSGFATAFLGVYDHTQRTLTYVNCGQEPGLICRAATGRVEELVPTGPVLGGFEGGVYAEQTVALQPGDILALFTDGMTEVGPTRKTLLEVEGVHRLLQGCAADPQERQDPQTIVSSLIAEIDSFSQGGVRDDVALLVGVVTETKAQNNTP